MLSAAPLSGRQRSISRRRESVGEPARPAGEGCFAARRLAAQHDESEERPAFATPFALHAARAPEAFAICVAMKSISAGERQS